MKLRYFTGIKTVEELDKARKDLLFIHHPDRNGGSEEKVKVAQNINAEYEYAKNKIENPTKKIKKAPQNDSKPQKDMKTEQTTPISQEIEHKPKKERFFAPEQVESMAKTGSKFLSSVFKGVLGGVAKKYNNS